MVPTKHSFHSRLNFDPVIPFSSNTAHNTHNKTSYNLQGGTAIACFGHTAATTVPLLQRKSNDPSGLGRWTSVLLTQTNNKNIRIISAYNPCQGQSSRTAHTSDTSSIRTFSQAGMISPTHAKPSA